MQTFSNIKKDMEFNRGLASLIEVLKTIAVSQYRALEHKLKSYEAFPAALKSLFDLICVFDIDHPFLNPKADQQVIVAVTSDSGLLGGLNMQIIGQAVKELEELPGRLVVVGERGKSYAQETGMPFTAFEGIREDERLNQAAQLRDYIMKLLVENSIGRLKIVYPHPISFTVQHVRIITLLPHPAGAKEAREPAGRNTEMIMESRPGDILEYLVHLDVGHKLYDIFGLSRLAEFAARYIHLEESLRKLKENDNKLRLQYFRVRHELIDRSMRELFSARLLYADR